MTAMLRGERPTIFGDGKQSRDFTYIDNAVEANILACTANGAAGRTFNVGCGDRVQLLDVMNELKVLLDSSLEPNFAPPRAGDVRDSLADISPTQEVLGYTAGTSFTEGLSKYLEWYRANH